MTESTRRLLRNEGRDEGVIEQAVDLQRPPEELAFEPVLRGAQVQVHLFDEARNDGFLLGLDGQAGLVYVERSEGGHLALSLERVRLLVFRPYPVPPAAQRALAGREVGSMRIEFRDHRRFEISCQFSSSDRMGMHLHAVQANRVRRLFVPRTAILHADREPVSHVAGDRARSEPSATPRVADGPRSGHGHASGTPRPRDCAALASRLGLPVADLVHRDTTRLLLDEIPAMIARRHRALPLGLVGDHLRVAMSSPTDTESLQLLQFLTGRSLQVEVADEEELLQVIEESYEFLDQDHDFEALEASSERAKTGDDSQELQSLSAAKPVVRLVNNILLEAVRRNASDVHIRPGENDVELIFRIDGQLVPIRRFSRGLLRAIVSRIKVLGQMDLTEHRVPQDGQARLRSRDTDLRISVIPSIEGESVVIRLLRATVGMKDLADLGLSAADTQHLRDALDRQHGMLLVTGPTGSGKSTTLYAALNAVIQRNVNIITLENPVEYHIPGIVQIPINAEVGMTFAAALRNVLRHDPDVVMVGEIRDRETAKIAVECSLTGHLLLSTLHTNSAVSTITRLIEMGVESYLARATLIGVLAQRLVRRTCPECRMIDEDSHVHVRKLLGVDVNEPFYRGKGCSACGGTGTRGRCMTYEYLVATTALRQLIAPGVDEAALQAQALSDGMVPLVQHALSLARAGTIDLLEAYRTRVE